MKAIIDFPYSSHEEFENRLTELAVQAFEQVLSRSKNNAPENLTRKQACEYLRISLSSLNNYTKEGYIKAYRIGKRVIYKKNELDQALRSIENMPKKLKRRK